MSALKRKIYLLETQLGELHQRISDRVDLEFRHTEPTEPPTEHLVILENILSQLSLSPQSHNILHNDKLLDVIARSRNEIYKPVEFSSQSNSITPGLSDISWLVSAKASTQILATVLKIFLENVLLLNEEIRYWEDIQESDWCVGLYAFQTSPSRAWQIYTELNRSDKGNTPVLAAHDLTTTPGSNRPSWASFYTSVRQCFSPGLGSVRIGLRSSLRRPKLEIQRKRRKLKAMRDFNASVVGLLLEKCLSFQTDSFGFSSDDMSQVVRSRVDLITSLLQYGGDDDKWLTNTLATPDNLPSFEGRYNSGIDGLEHPQDILEELIHVLKDLIPKYQQLTSKVVVEFGRPSPTVRYWIPLLLALISGTTSMKIVKDAGPVLIDWISNFGATAIGFWRNWVMDPMWKLVRTIRHDEKSEIALMSKNSLEADRASLERMVVDFVLDRGEQTHGSAANLISDKVREGDLTPVLKAYEKDLRSPFIGTVRGDLVRALLIQIQKTKVDVEIAMSGIDALLKSQELVFGFVGLTPGILISYASMRWLFGLLGSRRGFRMGRQQDDLRYALRNIHRILSTSTSTVDGRLPYKSRGLLICQVEILLKKAQSMLKGADLRAFQEDISDLVDESRTDKQLQVVERMSWTFSKWTR
ncbi:ATP synthase regulation protein NCA2-domain-containing protein [Aspergillus pseudoustus]|uniref:ATP synthase regulation protein NCA2-domain-containing protein n=1 Tax=Aspergillus pseudoustus TaxID=1810923 RepID=A0ABR4J7L6_9EURO